MARKWFLLNKNDNIATILLTLIIITAAVVLPLIGERTEYASNNKRQNQSLYNRQGYSQSPGYSQSSGYAQPGENDGSKPADLSKGELFFFDPNTADSTQLLRLGLSPWQVKNIYRYRAKGGRYNYPEDFARLYGLTLKQYRRLEPYIRIQQEVMAADVIKPHKERATSSNYSEPKQSGNAIAKGSSYNNSSYSSYNNIHARDTSFHRPNKLKAGETVDINSADTSLLKRIPGIGSYYARRIVELRQRHKVFVSVDELLSIRNFPESALSYMKVNKTDIPIIKINKMTLEQLENHPLLTVTQARDIMTLRRTTGAIRTLEDLRLTRSLSSQALQRIAPYIDYSLNQHTMGK
jgi:DNA uptake protein ComE-like DNA-binding protein